MQPTKNTFTSYFLLLTSYFLLLTSFFFLLSSPILSQEADPNLDLTPQNFNEVGTPSATPYPILPPPQNGFKLTVSPPVISLNTAAGEPITKEIKVKSFSAQPEDIRVSLMKFTADETGAKPKLLELEPTDQFPAWITFSEDRFILEPEVWKTISFTYSPPETAPPGQYFVIVFNREKEVEFTGGQVAKGAAAILVLSQISSSRVFHQLDLLSLDAKGFDFDTDKKIYEFLPVNFLITLQNSGNVHELPFGNIFIDWVTGNQTDVGIIDVNTERSFILPQTTRQYTNTWDNGFPVWVEKLDDAGNPVLGKDGNVKRKLHWDLSNITAFRIGKYRATLVMAYNDGIRDIPLEAQTEFWVIPWRILLALLVILIVIIIGVKGTISGLYRRLKNIKQNRPKTYPPPSQ